MRDPSCTTGVSHQCRTSDTDERPSQHVHSTVETTLLHREWVGSSVGCGLREGLSSVPDVRHRRQHPVTRQGSLNTRVVYDTPNMQSPAADRSLQETVASSQLMTCASMRV
eukprot:6998926-Alexandrium_andersonii.AAC.1